ncbi:hypothetical protein [Marivirga sp.]|uniref:hypothetical protein n=1 Tax=Marivirga sp. TaxID=2018662 RepID=UPI003DA78AD3
MLNISIDADDPKANHIPEDLSYNEQESIVEILVEKVLGFENAIQEFDDHDPEDHKSQNNITLDLFFPSPKLVLNSIKLLSELEAIFDNYQSSLAIGYSKVDNPPPIHYFL